MAFGLAQRTARPGEINGDPLDRYTIGHFAAGVLLGLGRVPLGWTIVLAIGWELVERPLKDAYPGLFPHASQDTFANAALDATAVVAGWGTMRAFPPFKLKRSGG